MTRKDYQLIADAVKQARYAGANTEIELLAIEDVVNNLVAALSADNPNFKPDLFRKACGIEPADEEDEATYKVTRFYKDEAQERETVATGLTREEAEAMCNDSETSSATATSEEARKRTAERGEWFCGWGEE